jgi:peptide/nickel transport system substrate-binding protein
MRRRSMGFSIGAQRAAAVCVLAVVVVCIGLPLAAPAAERGFTQHLTGGPTSLDPAKTNQLEADRVMWLLYDRLVQLSADGTRMEPALAERWEQSADGLTTTFTLRRHAVFHDGSPVDAEAVKISYERQFLTTSPFYVASPPNAYERVLSGLVRSIRVLDTHTLAITLHYQRPQQFAIVNIVSPQALKRYGGHLTRTPVGTGPFRLERWEADRIVLAPFADSWRGRPRLSHATFVVVPDSQAAVERLENGEFDLMPRVPPHLLERVGADPHLRLVELGGLNVRFLGMRMESRPLQDRRVREAIVCAVDLERLASLLGRGTLQVARGPLPPASLGYDPQVRQPGYDPQRARTLLREASPEGPPPLRLLYTASLEHWSEVAQAIRADLRKAGFQVELLAAPDWKDFHEQRRKGTHDLYLYQWSVSTPDPERFLYPLYHSTSSDNYGRYTSAKADEILTQARQPMDDTRRLRLYREATRLILADVPALFLFHQTAIAAQHVRAHGLALNLYGWPQDKLSTVEIR